MFFASYINDWCILLHIFSTAWASYSVTKCCLCRIFLHPWSRLLQVKTKQQQQQQQQQLKYFSRFYGFQQNTKIAIFTMTHDRLMLVLSLTSRKCNCWRYKLSVQMTDFLVLSMILRENSFLLVKIASVFHACILLGAALENRGYRFFLYCCFSLRPNWPKEAIKEKTNIKKKGAHNLLLRFHVTCKHYHREEFLFGGSWGGGNGFQTLEASLSFGYQQGTVLNKSLASNYILPYIYLWIVTGKCINLNHLVIVSVSYSCRFDCNLWLIIVYSAFA